MLSRNAVEIVCSLLLLEAEGRSVRWGMGQPITCQGRRLASDSRNCIIRRGALRPQSGHRTGHGPLVRMRDGAAQVHLLGDGRAPVFVSGAELSPCQRRHHTMPPSETSPLLPAPVLQPVSPHPIEADRGIAPEDAYQNAVADATGGDIERQISNGDASKHRGMPEVRKRLKYIFPAICIGVSVSQAL